ncbi:MAG: DUF123 domain-containing protein [Candidatus Bathyarchaeia archaeon]
MNSGSLDMLPQVGVYTLIIHLPANIRLKVGRLGEHQFPRGYYAYTGSALGSGALSLRKRVARHLQKKKHRFWHIDYLLARNDIVVTAIIAAQTNREMECEINRHLKNLITAKIPVLGFGASDCEENCGSHLLYLGERNVKQKVTSLYNEKFGCKTVAVDC